MFLSLRQSVVMPRSVEVVLELGVKLAKMWKY